MAVQAVGCFGFAGGAFASCSIPVPRGGWKPTGPVALRRATGGHTVTRCCAGTSLPGDGGQDGAWNLSLTLRPVPLPSANLPPFAVLNGSELCFTGDFPSLCAEETL